MFYKGLFKLKPGLSSSLKALLVPNNVRSLGSTSAPISPVDAFIQQHDHIQVALLHEPCIRIDANDKVLGAESKKNVHLLENIHKKSMLHRAFSVFIFNSQNELLVTQRSIYKILFPNHWTNACCSHPLHIEGELDEANEAIGVKQAARRRVNYELGIDLQQLDLSKFHYITRIHYKADNSPSDGIFGEHEIDYCLILQGDFKMKPLTNEVKATKYLNQYQLKAFLEEGRRHESGVLLTPWFKMICERFLFDWWSKLDKISEIKDHKNIHKLN